MKILTVRQRKHQCRKTKCRNRCMGLQEKIRNEQTWKTVQQLAKDFQKQNLKKFTVQAWQNNRQRRTIMEMEIEEKTIRIKSWKCIEKI